LINRYTFLNRLNEELAKSPCPLHAVILLDLDNFKSVNDLFGHAAGDFVLKVIAGRLEALAGDRATCARLSGDEFAIILLDDIDIDQFTQSLLGSLRRPIQINLQTILMRGTVGTMLPPFGGITADDALKNADIALYKAKANQKGGNIIYRKEFTTELNLRQKTLQMALDAVDRNGIIPYFQPIHDLASQTVVGAEVLMRIRKPDGKILGPGTFADALADPECATLLDLKILDNVSALLPRLTKGPNPPPYLSINAGSAQLRSAAFVQSLLDIHQRLHKHGSYVALEVVESVLFDDFNAELKNTLIRLSDAGLSIALDDFGTGYASLSHLRDYPIDTIKIDKSFIRDLGVRNDCAAIVRAIVDMGITLEKKVIAEGIETPAQLDYLRQIECPMVQGFLLGRPCPIDAFEEAFVLQQADH
jgi:diguanylate cyclase (GGDEF)-like protein